MRTGRLFSWKTYGGALTIHMQYNRDKRGGYGLPSRSYNLRWGEIMPKVVVFSARVTNAKLVILQLPMHGGFFIKLKKVNLRSFIIFLQV